MPRQKAETSKANSSSARLGFEETLWKAADEQRGHMDAADYKHVVLGLIFLKYISDAFEEVYDKLSLDEYADPEDRDEYLAENIFWVPKEHIRFNANMQGLKYKWVLKFSSSALCVQDDLNEEDHIIYIKQENSWSTYYWNYKV